MGWSGYSNPSVSGYSGFRLKPSAFSGWSGWSGTSGMYPASTAFITPKVGLDVTGRYYREDPSDPDEPWSEVRKEEDFYPKATAKDAMNTLISQDVRHVNDDIGWNRKLIYTTDEIPIYGSDPEEEAVNEFKPVGFTDAELKEIYIGVCKFLDKEPKWVHPEDAPDYSVEVQFQEFGAESSGVTGASRKKIVADRLQEIEAQIADHNRKAGKNLPAYIVAEELGVYEEREALLRERDDILEARVPDANRVALAHPKFQVHVESQDQEISPKGDRWIPVSEVKDSYMNFESKQYAARWIEQNVIDNPDVEIYFFDRHKPFVYILYNRYEPGDNPRTKRVSCRIETIQGWDDDDMREVARALARIYDRVLEERKKAEESLKAMRAAGVVAGIKTHGVLQTVHSWDRFDDTDYRHANGVLNDMFPAWTDLADWLVKQGVDLETIRYIPQAQLTVTTKPRNGPGPARKHNESYVIEEPYWTRSEVIAIHTYIENEMAKAKGYEKTIDDALKGKKKRK